MRLLPPEMDRILYGEAAIAERVAELGAEISRDYAGRDIIMVGVLKGAVPFMSDLMRAVTVSCTLDFLSVSSYWRGTQSSGVVRILKDLDIPLEGRDVLIVDDILDSGRTLSYIINLIESRNPASIRLCALLDKPDRRCVPVKVDYTGFTIPDVFIVGYGLDYAERFRNLPYIGCLKPEVYNPST
ncbi:MAG: hypoxanthine phosphoribosyltransferase [Oscillospiraceae bacterium]|nr:hypoxanthine phosphoribosyltransferase [Oscillospiraceae bacterium]